MSYEEIKKNNPDYLVSAIKDHPFKSLAKHNKKFFEYLAASLIGINPKALKDSFFVDTELDSNHKDDKTMTVDLLLWVNRVNNGYFINFEANTYKSESLDLKNTYYTYRLILNRQEIGKTYNPVKVYQINLDLLPLLFNKNIINVFTMTDPETREVLSGTPKIIHVALDKYEKDPYNKNISDWCG